MGIRVLRPGMLTTVQDMGRTGYQSQGFSVAGVMDVRSFKLANMLVDNPENEPVLEMTLMGPTLEFTSDTIIAITGGNFDPIIERKVGGKEPAQMYSAIYMHKGDVISFGSASSGARGYIAFSSFLKIPVVMGSRSTYLKCGVGGYKGRKLEKGDFLLFYRKRRYLPFFLSHKMEPESFESDTVTLRVVLGPQDDHFTKNGIETFLNSEYSVTSDFDRMGCRLEGPYIASKKTNIISDGIAFGSIQVPANGKPIILASDRQTTGGYPKIATVISADMPLLAQARTDTKIRFKAVTVQEAQRIFLEEEDKLIRLRETFHKPCKEVLECRMAAKRIKKLFKY